MMRRNTSLLTGREEGLPGKGGECEEVGPLGRNSNAKKPRTSKSAHGRTGGKRKRIMSYSSMRGGSIGVEWVGTARETLLRHWADVESKGTCLTQPGRRNTN